MEFVPYMRYQVACFSALALGSVSPLLAASFEESARLRADFFYLQRSKIHNKSLVVDDNITKVKFKQVTANGETFCCEIPKNVVLESKELVNDFDFRPGFSIGAEFLTDPDRTYDFSFLYMTEWEAERMVCGCCSLVFPFNDKCYTNDFNGADIAVGKYSSRYWQIEANYFGHLTPRNVNYFAFAALMGLRYINLREEFDLAFSTCLDTSNYNINTHNDLYGVQVGGNLQINPMPRLSFEIQSKFGYMVNRCGQDNFLGDCNNNIVLRDFSSKKFNGSWLIDFSSWMRYQLFPSFDFHGGYQLIYLTDLALAPEQIDKKTCPVNENRLYDKGQIFLEGGFVGIGFSF